MEPIIGNLGNRNKPNLDIKRPLTSKQDIPHIFLNQLMHPKNYLNADALNNIATQLSVYPNPAKAKVQVKATGADGCPGITN